MRIIICCLFLVVFAPEAYSSQDFTLNGETNFLRSGKAILRKVAKGDFYRSYLKSDTVEIKNNHFTFTGTISNPELFRIYLYDSAVNFISELFFLDSGTQYITMDSQTTIKSGLDVGYGLNVVGSIANSEYTTKYLPLFEESNKRMAAGFAALNSCDTIQDKVRQSECVSKMRNEISGLREIRNQLLYRYCLENRQSAIVPWMLFEVIRRYGFKNIFSSIYDSTSDYYTENVKIEIQKKLTILKSKTIGESFPFKNFIIEKQWSLYGKNKFTLVEFWFSSCQPCLAQFEELRPIYKQHSGNGFEVFAISIDGPPSFDKYKKLLFEKKYPWKQILDSNGTKTYALGIEKFPSSILLDANGKILGVDITPEYLYGFLEKNM